MFKPDPALLDLRDVKINLLLSRVPDFGKLTTPLATDLWFERFASFIPEKRSGPAIAGI
jgi:hypothetical protein